MNKFDLNDVVELRKEFDDKNIKRFYKVIDKNDNKISVEVIKENIINDNEFQVKELEPNLGKIYRDIDSSYFQLK